MHQQVKDKLHYYLPHKLRFNAMYPYKDLDTGETKTVSLDDRTLIGIDRENINLEGGTLRAWTKPKFRPLSSLTKPIAVEGYNDGKPFVPAEELNTDFSDLGKYPEKITFCQFNICEMLIRWHFWLWDQELFKTGDIIEIKD